MAIRDNTHHDSDPQSTSGPSSDARVTTPGAHALEECRTGPYLTGRLVGLACHLASRRPGASCERYADKIARSGMPPTPLVIATLNGMLARDLTRPGTPAAYRAAAADITGRLGQLDAWPPLPWPSASPAAAEFVLAQHHQSKELTDALADRG
jgi:hypothetical protein